MPEATMPEEVREKARVAGTVAGFGWPVATAEAHVGASIDKPHEYADIDAAAEVAYAAGRADERAHVVAHLTAIRTRPPHLLDDTAQSGWRVGVATALEHVERGEHLDD